MRHLTQRILRRARFLLRLCETPHEGCSGAVRLEPSRTRYRTSEPPGSCGDPNRNVWLCRACAEAHHQHWDEVWGEYYGGLL